MFCLPTPETYSDNSDHEFEEESSAVALKEDSVCVVVISDGASKKYERAVVESVYDNIYTLRLVDTGVQLTSSICDLRGLTKELAQSPICAAQCQLSGIVAYEEAG